MAAAPAPFFYPIADRLASGATPAGGDWIDVIDPATEETIRPRGSCQAASIYKDAALSARRAGRRTEWRGRSRPYERRPEIMPKGRPQSGARTR